MKIWFLLSRLEAGGLERVQAHLASAFRLHGLHPQIVAGRITPNGLAMLPPDLPVREVSRFGRLFFVPGLVRLLRRERPHVILTTSNDVACLLLWLRRLFFADLRIICTQHQSISGPLQQARGFKKLKLSIITWTMRKLLPRADALVAVSQAVASDMQSLLALSRRIEVIYNPVVLPDFESRSSMHINWPWPDDDAPAVIFVGRLSPEKRLDLLLEAFVQVRRRVPSRLLIVGDGPERERVSDRIRQSECAVHIRMQGFQPNPLPWIRQADLLVLPSDYEGFGMVLVEAMACGTQIVATDCPDGPAEILDDGAFGKLVPVGDVGALADAILAALEQPHTPPEHLMARAQRFTLEKAAHQYMTLIRHVADRA